MYMIYSEIAQLILTVQKLEPANVWYFSSLSNKWLMHYKKWMRIFFYEFISALFFLLSKNK